MTKKITEVVAQPMTRRDWLRRSGGLALAAAVVPMAFSADAHADSKMAKSAVDYQDHPKGKEQCDNCKLYIPGPSATADGQCKAVAGKISPKGWCNIYIPK